MAKGAGATRGGKRAAPATRVAASPDALAARGPRQSQVSGSTPPPTAIPAARIHEPVWLVRIVLVLFLAGFAAFLAREVSNFLRVLP